MLEAVDSGVWRILQTVARLGLTDNTIVIFTNDNGGEWLSNGSPLFKTIGRMKGLQIARYAISPRPPSHGGMASQAETLTTARAYHPEHILNGVGLYESRRASQSGSCA